MQTEEVEASRNQQFHFKKLRLRYLLDTQVEISGIKYTNPFEFHGRNEELDLRYSQCIDVLKYHGLG